MTSMTNSLRGNCFVIFIGFIIVVIIILLLVLYFSNSVDQAPEKTNNEFADTSYTPRKNGSAKIRPEMDNKANYTRSLLERNDDSPNLPGNEYQNTNTSPSTYTKTPLITSTRKCNKANVLPKTKDSLYPSSRRNNNNDETLTYPITPKYPKSIHSIRNQLIKSGIRSPRFYEFITGIQQIGHETGKLLEVCVKEFEKAIKKFNHLHGNEILLTNETQMNFKEEPKRYANKANEILHIYESGDIQTFRKFQGAEIIKDNESIKVIEGLLQKSDENMDESHQGNIPSLNAIHVEMKLNELQAAHVSQLNYCYTYFTKCFEKIKNRVKTKDTCLVLSLYTKYMSVILAYKKSGLLGVRAQTLDRLWHLVREFNEKYKRHY